MNNIILTSQDGSYQAIFDPNIGLNLLSFQKNNLEIIDQDTKNEFDLRRAGLGPLIGPHFHRQKPEWVTHPKDPNLFPHIPVVQKMGVEDLFSHGVGRYVPWSIQPIENGFIAKIHSEMRYKHVSYESLEGCRFSMEIKAVLLNDGLHYEMQVKAGRPCLIGIHYYYKLYPPAYVTSTVKQTYNDMGVFKPMKDLFQKDGQFFIDLNEAQDFGFLPHNDHHAEFTLHTQKYRLITRARSSHDLSVQVYHPKDASFACIEPASALNPRNLTSNESSIAIHLEVQL